VTAAVRALIMFAAAADVPDEAVDEEDEGVEGKLARQGGRSCTYEVEAAAPDTRSASFDVVVAREGAAQSTRGGREAKECDE